MARTIRDASLETRAARLRLPEGRKPVWRQVETGLALGYRRGPKGGRWFARRFADGRYIELGLGIADDMTDADGKAVLNYRDAVAAARAWWQTETRREAGEVEAGSYTVRQALDDYLAIRDREGRSTVADRYRADALILPALGDLEVTKLTARKLRDWRDTLVKQPPLARTGRSSTQRNVRDVDLSDPEVLRARRASANRVWTILRAALNKAWHDHRVASDEAWRRVKPFGKVDVPVVVFMSDADVMRLVNAAERDFRELIRGAVHTGCRYGELARMVAGDFNSTAGTVTVRRSKAGWARHVVLSEEGQALFTRLTAGKRSGDLIFQRADDGSWGKSHQQRPWNAALNAAGLDATFRFHDLRHVHGSRLAMAGTPMAAIAAQLGHADTRMTERHYAHLRPNYVAEAVRAGFAPLGIAGESNVTPLRQGRERR